jgi:serine/threonine protein kinase
MLTAKYKITRKLHDTLQGVIYEARQLSTNRRVAIKFADQSQIQNSSKRGVLEDLDSEIALMKKVRSERVIEVLELFEDAQGKYAVMEYAENGDLFSKLAKLGSFDEDTAKEYFQQIALSLKELHSKRVCHLDISPENVLIAKNGSLKLCDFGVSRIILKEGLISTSDGKFRPGKLMYMSPECSVLDEFNGFHADIYSLGVVLFCMLYGFNPYSIEAVLKFRGFFERKVVSSSYDDEFSVEQYVSHLQSTNQLSPEDIAYALVLCGDTNSIFDMYRIRGIASKHAEELVCSMLTLQESRISLEAILRHPLISG